ncbi:MAG: DUF4921 family protein [Pirellula sp.]|jgi:UDPglucose--hexose-1-phosphate uridylyltransferase|nr:DUF4921 family protein [Pirellula sp.]
MNEMRHDWLSDRWVIYAPNRTTRPDDYDRTSHIEPESRLRCPFCRGSEHETPEATLVLPSPDWESTRSTRQGDLSRTRAEWLVRVVPNKFPAVTYGPPPIGWSHPDVDEIRERRIGELNDSDPASARPLFIKRSTVGAHEVIIESPQHVTSLTQLSDDHTQLVFEAYRQRLKYWRARREMKYAVVFKNYGADAGATLVHSHSQLICTSFIPSDVLRIQKRLALYHETHERCYVCSVLEKEIEARERVVRETDHCVAICPFASRFPFSVSILPKRHRARYEDCSTEELADLSKMVRVILRAIEAEHPRCAYNLVLQTSHFDHELPDAFHWRLKVIPRLSKIAGFEWSSDCFINTVLPEAAAQSLRNRIQTLEVASTLSRVTPVS